MVPGADAVVFVDDQDTERGGGALSYASGATYVLANIFTLAWDYGTPMVLSDYAYSSYDQGPAGAGGNAIAAPGCGSGTWECEQRWPAIAGGGLTGQRTVGLVAAIAVTVRKPSLSRAVTNACRPVILARPPAGRRMVKRPHCVWPREGGSARPEGYRFA
jgi:hypothetical protein